MEICRKTSLIYADYCYSFSTGNIEPFWRYQNFSPMEDIHVHCPPPLSPPPYLPIQGLNNKGRVKKDNEKGGHIPGENFLGGDFPREFDGWEFSRGEFS